MKNDLKIEIMSKNFKIFLCSFLFAFPFWWGTNLIEKNLNYLFLWQVTEENPQIATAQISSSFEDKEPEKPVKEPLQIEAKAVFSAKFTKQGDKEILLKNNEREKLPIASLTKLTTAVIALDNYPKNQQLKVDKEAVQQPGEVGLLKPDEILPMEELLAMALIESSNDAAYALAQGQESFIEQMNLKAENWNLSDTKFFNPTGLDSLEKNNYSTAEDLADLSYHIVTEYPEIFEISRQINRQAIDGSRDLHHLIENTNRLIGVVPNLLGGKTGYTEKAGGCILIVLQEDDAYIINVILGAVDQETRFDEMEKLINWLK